MRELIMLGVGSAMVTNTYNTCFLIKENDEYLLVDAGGGNGILKQLEAAEVPVEKIKSMFITHAHIDHVLGAIWVIRKVATLMNQEKYPHEFNIYCHDKVAELLVTLANMTLKKKNLEEIGKRIHIVVLEDGDTVEPMIDTKLTAFDIQSQKAKQYGFKLEFVDGERICCLGDEPYNPANQAYVENVKWLLSEAFCLYADREKFKPYEKNHSTVKEACELATELSIPNLVLYHTEDKDMANRQRKYLAEGKAYYQGNLYVPNELEVIKL